MLLWFNGDERITIHISTLGPLRPPAFGQFPRDTLHETFAQAMHCHAGRAFVHAQSLRDGRIVNRAAHRHETVFHRVVFAGFAARGELHPEPVDGRPNQANRSEPVRAAYCRH